MIAVPPDNGDDDAVPEGPDAALALGVDALGSLPAENFVTQRGSEKANHTVNGGGDNGDLDAAGPGKIREASVVVSAEWFGRIFLGGILGGIGKCGAGCVGCGHGFAVRLPRRRRDV